MRKISAQKVFELAINGKSLWESGTTQEKLEYLKQLCSNPVLEGPTIQYQLKKAFVTIGEMKSNPEWRSQGESKSSARTFHKSPPPDHVAGLSSRLPGETFRFARSALGSTSNEMRIFK